MAEIDLMALIPYVFITTFTPGPNNISSAAMASRFGFYGSMNYMLGIGGGVFILMSLSGSLSSFLMSFLPSLESVMRWVGALYIVYLGLGFLKDHDHSSDEALSGGFVKGMLLQCVNIKVIIYGVTLYTAFLSPILSKPLPVLISALSLALVCFSSVICWALFGVAIERFLNSPFRRKCLNYFFAILLFLTAMQVADII